MKRTKTGRFIAGLMSFLMIFTTLFAGDVMPVRADGETYSINLQMSLASGVDANNYGFDYVVKDDNGDETTNKGYSNSVSLSGIPSGYTLEVTAKTAGKQIWANGTAIDGNEQKDWEDGKTFTINSNIEYNFQLNNPPGGGQEPQGPGPGDIQINVNNGQNGKVEYKVGDGSWNEIGGNSFTLRKNTELNGIVDGTKIYFKATPNQDQALDTNDGQNRVRYDDADHNISTADLSNGSFYIDFYASKNYSLQISFEGGPQGPGPGDIQINVNNGQNGKVEYKIDEGSWNAIDGSSFTLRKGNELNGIVDGTKIYIKATPNQDQALDTNDGQNRVRYDDADHNISTADLSNGSFCIEYSASKNYSLQIAFVGGSQGPGPVVNPEKINVSIEVGSVLLDSQSPIIIDGHQASDGVYTVEQADSHEIEFQVVYGKVVSKVTVNNTDYSITNLGGGKIKVTVPDSVAVESNGVKTYSVKLTEGVSDDVTIVWAYDHDYALNKYENDDAWVEHGRVELVSIKRGDSDVTDGIHIDDEGGYLQVKKDDDVTIKLIPDYGYQVVGAKINGEVDLTAGETTNEFTFKMPHTNVHFKGIFTKTEDIKVNNASTIISNAEFTGDKIAKTGGTAKMTIGGATAADSSIIENIDSTKAVQAVDISMEQLFYKNTPDDVWATEKSELDEPAEVNLTVSQEATGYAVLRTHNNVVEKIPSVYDATTGTISFNSSKYSTYTLVPVTENPGLMDGFPTDFGTGELSINARDRVDMDNNDEKNPENMFASGEFSVLSLPSGCRTLNDLVTKYNVVKLNEKIIACPSGCTVSEIKCHFDVELVVDGRTDRAAIEFIQTYTSAKTLTVGEDVTFDFNMSDCKAGSRMKILTPLGLTFNDIKDKPIVGIACDYKLSQKGTVSYVAPGAEGFTINTTKPYLDIVIPEMEIKGAFNSWGGWNNIKAVYNAAENKGTGFTTYRDLLTNYKGIKIKVDISNINPKFNKDNELFFYLHDPLDGMQPGTVNNGVKYDITDAHVNKQYVNKNGGVQEFTFDFAGTYYMDGDAAPDIWLSMCVESRPAPGEESDNVHYCDVKPIIENGDGSITLAEGFSKMQFTDASNSANGGLMDVEKATKISLNVSDEADALTAIAGTQNPSDAKQAQLKTLIDANSEMGTDSSSKEQVKQVVEINLSVDGTEIQPKGNSVKVTFPASKFNVTDSSKMKLYHHTGEELVEMTGVVVKDGKISFDTPSFSYFVVVEENEVSNQPENNESKPTTNGANTISQTSKAKEESNTDNTPVSTSHAGGSNILASSMLIRDINATVAGNTLVVDPKYNRQFLTNAEMKALLKKGTIALRMQYNYNGVEYDITIPASLAANDEIPYYGPLYLASHFPATKIAEKANGNNLSVLAEGKATKGVVLGKYIVKRGDNLYKIARKFGTTLSDVVQKNPQIRNINRIYPGQLINI